MNLLAEEKIVWTVPAPAWARKLLKELKALETMGSKGKRRDEIIKELPTLTQYRLTFTSVTMREETQRETLLGGVREWFEETYGIAPGDFATWFFDKHVSNKETEIEYPEGDKLSKDEAAGLYMMLRDSANWATIMACLRVVEKRQVPMHLAEEPDAPWHKDVIPPEWKNFDSFMDSFPRPLFKEATAICLDLNPGVWTLEMDEDSKNVGGVNVRG